MAPGAKPTEGHQLADVPAALGSLNIVAMTVVPAPAGIGLLGPGSLCAARRRTR